MTSDNEKKSAPYSPKINLFGHDQFRQCMRTAHDLGGEEVHEPIEMEEKGETKEWMSNTYVTCECLAWRGVWNTVEKHRRHVDLGTKQYLELPYYGRWILTAARVLVDKEHVTLTELMNKMEEVKNRL
ncbi:MAG: nitrile hydratase subunit beta [Desulfobulbaceae bacterium]|nr:nitrile hydratase subunit beta [Gammaproteobacteria bacterium]MCP4342991.1 nitrile hydratase subunit beta [Desulfobulbaceae bacterium]